MKANLILERMPHGIWYYASVADKSLAASMPRRTWIPFVAICRGVNMIIESLKPEDTFEIGHRLGKMAVKGEVYCLLGDLGVGKTVFTQGFAKGLSILEPISSPTFTIIQIYEEGRMPFYHFDVYRIADVDEMDEIGYEDYFYNNGVCLIEWANLIEEIIPRHRKTILIEKNLEYGFDYRKITVEEGRTE